MLGFLEVSACSIFGWRVFFIYQLLVSHKSYFLFSGFPWFWPISLTNNPTDDDDDDEDDDDDDANSLYCEYV